MVEIFNVLTISSGQINFQLNFDISESKKTKENYNYQNKKKRKKKKIMLVSSNIPFPNHMNFL